MGLRKLSTAYNRVFSFVSLSLTSISVTISKNGGSFNSPSGSLSNITGNFYNFAGNSGDADTLGDIAYKFSDTILGIILPDDDTSDQVVTNLPGDGVMDANIVKCNGSTVPSGGLPNAAAGASGGLLINGSNTGSIALGNTTLGTLTTNAVVVSTASAAAVSIQTSADNGTALAISTSGTPGNGVQIFGSNGGKAVGIEATDADVITVTAFGSTGGDAVKLRAAGAGVDLDVTNNLPANTAAIAGNASAATNLKNTYAAFETGTAQAGGASTVTLRAGASAVNDFYLDQVVFVISGTGAPQTNRITGYVGATKVATVETAWATAPDNTSVYLVLGRVG